MRFVLLSIVTSVSFAQPFVVSFRGLQEQSTSKSSKALARARQACSQSRVADCKRLIDEALEKDPHSTQALLMAGVFAIQQQDYDAAGKALDAAVEQDPMEPFLLSVAALAHGLLEDYEGAENLAKRSLRRDPLCARANFILGVSLVAQRKELDEAERSFTRAADEVRESRLFLTYLQLRRGEEAGAARVCREFLRREDATTDTCLALLQ